MSSVERSFGQTSAFRGALQQRTTLQLRRTGLRPVFRAARAPLCGDHREGHVKHLLARLHGAVAQHDLDRVPQHTVGAAAMAMTAHPRRMPDSIVLLLIAMALLRERSIADAANELCWLRSGPDNEPVKSNAIRAARARLGEAPSRRFLSTR
jgi:hypothetical protein